MHSSREFLPCRLSGNGRWARGFGDCSLLRLRYTLLPGHAQINMAACCKLAVKVLNQFLDKDSIGYLT